VTMKGKGDVRPQQEGLVTNESSCGVSRSAKTFSLMTLQPSAVVGDDDRTNKTHTHTHTCEVCTQNWRVVFTASVHTQHHVFNGVGVKDH
jgi:hypothetical protein